MSSSIKVLILGATGTLGPPIVDGLLKSSTHFEVKTITRPSSYDNDVNKAFRERGVKTIGLDILGPKESVVAALAGIDVLISTIHWTHLEDQIPLIAAAKEAGVKRFVPCSFAPPAARGVMSMYDRKLAILDAAQRAHLPYTHIDVGWLYHNIIPALPSGRTADRVIPNINDRIPGDGSVRVALTCLDDVGLYVSHIVADPRTLNQKVFVYTEVMSMNETCAVMEDVSGEKVEKVYVTEDELAVITEMAKKKISEDPTDFMANGALIITEYLVSWGVRGDNTPENAAYLGFLDFKELYPGIVGQSLKSFFGDVLQGKGTNPFEARHFYEDVLAGKVENPFK